MKLYGSRTRLVSENYENKIFTLHVLKLNIMILLLFYHFLMNYLS
jgi:hypothetical protein